MKKVLVTGGYGLVGSAIQEIKHEYDDLIFIFLSSKYADLTVFEDTRKLFNDLRPNYVIHLAACVGGLFKNMNHKSDMFEINMLINMNVLRCCYEFNVEKVVSCLSTCIFPNKTTYPIDETMLHNGEPHESNYAYAHSKRMLDIHSRIYREQYGKNFICVIPTNIYGKSDNFSLTDGHVIPALIHQCYLAKKEKKPFVVKGTGSPLRQFIYSADLAKLIMWTLLDYDKKDNIILSVGEKDEVSIRDIANEISKAFNYNNIKFDGSFSDGQYKKTADNSRLMKYNPNFKFTSISDGIKKSVFWFTKNFDTCRK